MAIVEENKVSDKCVVRFHDDSYRNRSPDEVKHIIKTASAIVINGREDKTA